MSATEEHTTELISSDSIHNKNCFSYLKNIKFCKAVLNKLPSNISLQILSVLNQEKYDSSFPYADVYTQLFNHIEENIATLYENPADKAAVDEFIFSIYDNDNHMLEETFKSIRDIALDHTPSSKSIESSITDHISDKHKSVNVQAKSPEYEGSAYGRFKAMIADNYKPQHGTSLATIRHYHSNQNSSVREYRFGTQGQRHQGKARVSPLFERFLEIQAERAQDKITHIYFNNLGRDRTKNIKDVFNEGVKERALTLQLEALEERHKNVAVITLPADKGLMSGQEYKKNKPVLDPIAIKQEFLFIAQEDPRAQSDVRDFHISESVRRKIFCNSDGVYSKEIEQAKLNELINKSFEALGLSNKEKLSHADRQAVYFHFIKYELTNHIIESIEPKSINFSCKDAIDRGGVSSAYYNLIKSFQPQTEEESQLGIPKIPMSRDEFEQALHAAPTAVKARGMNHHLKLIWNSVDVYVNQNYKELKNDPSKAWLIEWRDFNCPHERVKELLARRIQEYKHELQEHTLERPVTQNQQHLITRGLSILDEIEKQSSIGVSGKRLLLEAAARTTSMALDPKTQTEPKNLQQYENLSDKLSIKYPRLQIVGGLMKALAGEAIRILSLGKVKDIASSGWATYKAGCEVLSRKSIQENMKDQLKKMRENALEHQEQPEATPVEKTRDLVTKNI